MKRKSSVWSDGAMQRLCHPPKRSHAVNWGLSSCCARGDGVLRGFCTGLGSRPWLLCEMRVMDTCETLWSHNPLLGNIITWCKACQNYTFDCLMLANEECLSKSYRNSRLTWGTCFTQKKQSGFELWGCFGDVWREGEESLAVRIDPWWGWGAHQDHRLHVLVQHSKMSSSFWKGPVAVCASLLHLGLAWSETLWTGQRLAWKVLG